MAFPQSSRAYVDPSKPVAWGCCDRCGFRYLDTELVFQWDWRGASLSNLQIRVCTLTCLDKPFELNRPILLGPDPIPTKFPRPGYAATQQGYTVALSPLEIVSDDGAGSIIPQPTDDFVDSAGNLLIDSAGNLMFDS